MAAKNETQMSAVVMANWFQFGPGQEVVQARIESRALLWCKHGRGNVQVNRAEYAMRPGRYLLLPWARRLVYAADRRTPYLLAAVHWIPWHDKAIPIWQGVAHARLDPYADVAWRQDRALGDWTDQVREGEMGDSPALYHLAEYLVTRHALGDLAQEEIRPLTAMFIQEVLRTLSAPAGPGVGASAGFLRMTKYMRDHLGEAMGLEELADFGGCSRATVVRMFSREAKCSPMTWLARARVERAMELLQRTPASIGEVAERVGMADAHYFSRVFRKHAQISPREFRRRNRMF